jgi:hypothetical protein
VEATDVLDYFGFTEIEIGKWTEQRRYLEQVGVSAVPPSEVDVLSLFPSFIWPEYVSAFFIGLFSNSNIHLGDYYMPIAYTRSQEWVDSKDRRELVGAAVRQFMSLVDTLMFNGREDSQETRKPGWTDKNTDTLSVSLICKYPDSGPLHDFLDMYRDEADRALAEAGPKHEPTWDDTLDELQVVFPFNLFRKVVIDSEPFVVSDQFKVFNYWNGSFVGSDIFAGRKLNGEGTNQENFNQIINGWYRHWQVDMEHYASENSDGSSVTIKVVGYDVIAAGVREAGERFSEVEMGISGLRMEPHNGNNLYPYTIAGQELFDTKKNPFNVTIQWQDKNSGKWLYFHQASRGQQDLILLFLQFSMRSDPDNYFVLADEFDRHLHPTVAAQVLEALHHRAMEVGAVVIASTHSVPMFNSSVLRSLPRIYAQRTADGGFDYKDSATVDSVAMAEILGVSPLDAKRLNKLLVIMEGEHDVLIVNHLFGSDDVLLEQIEVSHTDGIHGFSGTWNNVLRHLDSPVLFVYDKRNLAIEEAWTKTQKAAALPGSLNLWSNSSLWKILDELTQRKRGKKVSGDVEAEKILYLLKGIIKSDQSRTYIPRVHLHGVAYDDIIDCLPIRAFKGPADIKTWEDAHRKYQNGNILKKEFVINSGTVKSALAMNKDKVDPELTRLYASIRALVSTETKNGRLHD